MSRRAGRSRANTLNDSAVEAALACCGLVSESASCDFLGVRRLTVCGDTEPTRGGGEGACIFERRSGGIVPAGGAQHGMEENGVHTQLQVVSSIIRANSLVTNAIGYNLTDAASRTETRISLTQQHACSLSQPRAVETHVETDGDL